MNFLTKMWKGSFDFFKKSFQLPVNVFESTNLTPDESIIIIIFEDIISSYDLNSKYISEISLVSNIKLDNNLKTFVSWITLNVKDNKDIYIISKYSSDMIYMVFKYLFKKNILSKNKIYGNVIQYSNTILDIISKYPNTPRSNFLVIHSDKSVIPPNGEYHYIQVPTQNPVIWGKSLIKILTDIGYKEPHYGEFILNN